MLSLQRTLSFRYLRQRRMRAALIVVSIALGVAIVVATRTLNQSLNDATLSAASPLAKSADLMLTNSDLGVPLALVPAIPRVPV